MASSHRRNTQQTGATPRKPAANAATGGGWNKSTAAGACANYIQEQSKCLEFLQNFTNEEGNNTYIEQIQSVVDRNSSDVVVRLDDVLQHSRDGDFVNRVLGNTLRYHTFFSRAADQIFATLQPADGIAHRPIVEAEAEQPHPYEIFQAHREARYAESLQAIRAANPEANARLESPFPVELSRRFQLRIVPPAVSSGLHNIQKMREIKAADIGNLVSVRGIVTRVSDVQPLVQVVTYICQVCGYESYQTVNDKQFMPLNACPSPQCKANESTGKLVQQTRGSKFVRYQMVKLQELPHEVPVGHIPRSITLRLEGGITRSCKPGDYLTVHGIFLPTPFSGFRAIRAGLTTETYIQVEVLENAKKSFKNTTISDELAAEIQDKSQDPNIYEQLASSIAPEIYGHIDIKKALILLLAGGVTRILSDGLKIRGDINVLLCGDPGVAKSQLLKHITSIAPRCVYTTGKGSSGVGLTAAVLRDPVTGDMTLEGGALVLADMGICCIDEFDKMEESDRTAIHEVMEQQTVSIAKAGITTTLNARTSILAAANPVFGRYKPRATVEENIGLPTALLSRFDLTYIILDTPNADNDENLAKHITYVHQHSASPESSFLAFTPEFLRGYIAVARDYEPTVPKQITDFIVGSYVSLRKENNDVDRNIHSSKNTRTRFCTARMLLSILRLSQALARIHMRATVQKEDCEEAIRLLYVSKNSIDVEGENNRKRLDFLSDIYDIIRKYAIDMQQSVISRAEIRQRCVTRGYSDEQVETTLEEYEELGIWQANHTHIRFMTEVA